MFIHASQGTPCMHQHAGSCAHFLHGKTKCCMLHPVSDNITLGCLSGNSSDEHKISKNRKDLLLHSIRMNAGLEQSGILLVV